MLTDRAGATLTASASAPKKELDDAFPIQSTGSTLLQSSDQVGASEYAPSSELTQSSDNHLRNRYLFRVCVAANGKRLPKIAREPRAKNLTRPLPCKGARGGPLPPSRGCWSRSASARVNACLSMARRWYGSCREDPRLGSGADRRVCPTADLWFRDEAAIDRRVRARPLATQMREPCR